MKKLFLCLTLLGCVSALRPDNLLHADRSVVISACILDDAGEQRYGAFSEEGEQILPHEYTWIWRNEWGLLLAYTGKGLLIFDSSGQPFIRDTVESVRAAVYEDNRMAVLKNGKWGYYDKDGKLVIKHQFSQVSDFYGGYAKCVLKGKTIAIDTKGTRVSLKRLKDSYHYSMEEIIELTMIPPFFDPEFRVKKENGLYGLITLRDEWVIPPLYDEFRENFHRKTLAILKGRWGVLDYSGNVILPFEYEELRVLW